MYKESIKWSCVGQTPELDIEKAAKWVQEVLTNACDYSMPRAKPPKKDSVYWCNPTIVSLRKECHKAGRKWQKAKAKKDKSIILILKLEDIYKENKKDLRNEIKEAKIRAWDELIHTIEQDSWDLPYRIVLKKLRRASPSLTETLKLNILTKIIDKLFPEDPYWNAGTTDDDEDIEWRDEYNVSIQEFCNILKKGSNANKAPGIDGIKSIFLERIPEIFLR